MTDAEGEEVLTRQPKEAKPDGKATEAEEMHAYKLNSFGMRSQRH